MYVCVPRPVTPSPLLHQGRGGKGVIYVWASGNGGLEGDNCNLDGYVSSIFTLAVSALTDAGASVFYGEPCASTLAGVFVGGEHTLEAALEKRERHQQDIHLVRERRRSSVGFFFFFLFVYFSIYI